MAANQAAILSALGGRADRRSPPPAVHSMRYCKRQIVLERLAQLNDKFQLDKDATYRDQLQRIQFELTILQKFDPYSSGAAEAVEIIQREYKETVNPPVRAENARSIMEMSGVQFPQFMFDIQDTLEARDYQLTQSKNEHDRKVQEYNTTYTFKIETAKREHESLNDTIRDRIFTQLSHKKARMQREKEALDLTETSALIFNPAHFNLAHPGSPGGHAGKRSTRNRKEADSHDGFGENKKRKRQPGDDDGSPAPTRRILDANATTPYWQSEKARSEARKQGAFYSIGSLFTEKELVSNYTTAALAAHNQILRTQANGSGPSSESSHSENEDADMGEVEPQPAALPMERQVSHATRSTWGANTNQNLVDDKAEDVRSVDPSSSMDLLHGSECTPRMPSSMPHQYIKHTKHGLEVNAPDPLSDKEVTADLQLMNCLKKYDHARQPGSHLDNPRGMRKTLQTASIPYHSSRYVAFARARPEDPPKKNGNPAHSKEESSPSAQSQQPQNGQSANAVPMSRQSSAKGAAMSRQGTTGSGRTKTRKS